MTDQHPITPPPELVKKWVAMLKYCEDIDVFTDVARWGADIELEACCAWVGDGCAVLARDLRDARRPKPPSLKEQALEVLNEIESGKHGWLRVFDKLNTIRRALEQLDD